MFCPEYDLKLHLVGKLQFWKKWSYPLVSSSPCPLCRGVEPDRLNYGWNNFLRGKSRQNTWNTHVLK